MRHGKLEPCGYIRQVKVLHDLQAAVSAGTSGQDLRPTKVGKYLHGAWGTTARCSASPYQISGLFSCWVYTQRVLIHTLNCLCIFCMTTRNLHVYKQNATTHAALCVPAWMHWQLAGRKCHTCHGWMCDVCTCLPAWSTCARGWASTPKNDMKKASKYMQSTAWCF